MRWRSRTWESHSTRRGAQAQTASGDHSVHRRRTTSGSGYRPTRRDQADARPPPRAHRGAVGARQGAEAREAGPGRRDGPPRRVHPRRGRPAGPEARLAARRRRREDRPVQRVDQGQHVRAGVPREGDALPGLDRRLLVPRRRRLRHPAAADEEVGSARGRSAPRRRRSTVTGRSRPGTRSRPTPRPARRRRCWGPNDLGPATARRRRAPRTAASRRGCSPLPVGLLAAVALGCIGYGVVRWARQRGKVRELRRSLASRP